MKFLLTTTRPLQKGEIAHIGYRLDLEANLYAVRPADGMPPYPLGHLLAAADEMRARLAAIIDARDRTALNDADPAYLMIDRAIEAARVLLEQIA